MDSPPRKRKITPKDNSYPWEEIRALYASGVSPKTLKRQFNIPTGTLNHRMFKYNWAAERAKARALANPRTISDMQSQDKTLAISAPKNLGEAIEQDWADKGNNHRVLVHEIVSELMEQVKASPPEVETMKDLDILDQIARRAYGLEEKEKMNPASRCIINMAFLTQAPT